MFLLSRRSSTITGNEAIERFSIDRVASRQRAALDAAGLTSEPTSGEGLSSVEPRNRGTNYAFQIALTAQLR